MKAYRNIVAKVGGVVLLVGGFAVLSATPADAALMVYVCDDVACSGGGDFVVTDNDANDDSAVEGSINTEFGEGGDFGMLSGSYPAVGSAGEPVLTMSYQFTAAGMEAFGGAPFIYATQDGFTASPGTAFFEADASTGGGTATAWSGLGTFDPAVPGSILAGPCSIDPAACNESAPVGAAPYYLAIGIAPTAGAGGAATGDASIEVEAIPVPEPATMALFGMGLFGAAVAARRRRPRA